MSQLLVLRSRGIITHPNATTSGDGADGMGLRRGKNGETKSGNETEIEESDIRKPWASDRKSMGSLKWHVTPEHVWSRNAMSGLKCYVSVDGPIRRAKCNIRCTYSLMDFAADAPPSLI